MLSLLVTDTTGTVLHQAKLLHAVLTEGLFGAGALVATCAAGDTQGNTIVPHSLLNTHEIKPWHRVVLIFTPTTGQTYAIWHGWVKHIEYNPFTITLRCTGLREYLARKILNTSHNYNNTPLQQILTDRWNFITLRHPTNMTIQCSVSTPVDIILPPGMSMLSLMMMIERLGYEWRHSGSEIIVDAVVGDTHTQVDALRYHEQNPTTNTIEHPTVHSTHGENYANYLVAIGSNASFWNDINGYITPTEEEIGDVFRSTAVYPGQLNTELGTTLTARNAYKKLWKCPLLDRQILYAYRPHDTVSVHITTQNPAIDTQQDMRVIEKTITLNKKGITGELVVTPDLTPFRSKESLTERIQLLESTS